MNTEATLLAIAAKLPETSGLRVACRGYAQGHPDNECPCAGRGWTLAPDAGGEMLLDVMQAAGWHYLLAGTAGGETVCNIWRDALTISSKLAARRLEATLRAAAQALGVEVSE